MKLKKINRSFILRGEEITVYTIGAIKAMQLMNVAKAVEDKPEETLRTFAQAIYEYTNLKDENTQEEILDILTAEEITELGLFIISDKAYKDMKGKEANFTRDQNIGNLTTGSE